MNVSPSSVRRGSKRLTLTSGWYKIFIRLLPMRKKRCGSPSRSYVSSVDEKTSRDLGCWNLLMTMLSANTLTTMPTTCWVVNTAYMYGEAGCSTPNPIVRTFETVAANAAAGPAMLLGPPSMGPAVAGKARRTNAIAYSSPNVSTARPHEPSSSPKYMSSSDMLRLVEALLCRADRCRYLAEAAIRVLGRRGSGGNV